MQKAWAEIERLTSVNAKHRKGWRLGDITPQDELKDAASEMIELACTPDFFIEELADVFGCLIGFAVKCNWSMTQVEEALLKKLGERFTG